MPVGCPYKLKDVWFNPKDPEQVAKTLDWCKNVFRNESVENALVMTSDGEIWRSVVTVDAVNLDGAPLDGAPLDGATVVHNHPEEAGGGSFGSDDYKFLRDHLEVAELWAVTEDYNHVVRVLKPLDIDYGNAYGMVRTSEIGDDYKHLVMEWLREQGYIDYRRLPV